MDLGCGSGILSIAAMLVGSGLAFSVDVDLDALVLFRSNVISIFKHNDIYLNPEIILSDASTPFFRQSLFIDCTITNPPFGTKGNAGIDVFFVKSALKFSSIVYSFHKTSTRDFLIQQKLKQFNPKVLAKLNFDIKNTYWHHKKEHLLIEVDLIRSISQNTIKLF